MSIVNIIKEPEYYYPAGMAEQDGLMTYQESQKLSNIPTPSNIVTKSSTVGLLKNDGTVDTTSYATVEPYFEQSVTLSTSQTTTVTFSNAAFTANSVVDPAISVWGIFPEDVTVANGSCTVVMPKVSTALTVIVGIFIKR